MVNALTSEQVNQVINNTVIVILARPDLMMDWHENLTHLLHQAQNAEFDDEAIFIAAVMSLLHSPEDSLPTGTLYDRAWDAILSGVQTGTLQAAEEDAEAMTLERLLNSIIQAVMAAKSGSPEQKTGIEEEMRTIRAAASQADAHELIAWLDDILALLGGTPARQLGKNHQGVYANYWKALMQDLRSIED
jgi:hypothetical protein